MEVEIFKHWQCFNLPQEDLSASVESPALGHRDRVNKKVMADPRLANMIDPKAMPFDSKRMVYGGFKSLVEL